MNKKAEAFQNYLDADENKKTAFQREEVKEDTQKTVVFRSHIVVEGQQLPSRYLHRQRRKRMNSRC